MKKQNNEFLGLLCNLYLVALLFALPLYTGQGYWQLGNTKYTFFRNVTLLCLGCWLVAGMPARLRAAVKVLKGKKSGPEKPQKNPGEKPEPAAAVSGMDAAAAAYGIFVLASAAGSEYGALAWKGYEGWFMGAVSQLLFVGIYFFVSRQYDGASWPLYLGEGALALVTGLGLLHRLGIDPLGLMEGWNSGDWEYSHMLSTLGNINWLCGYYSVALAFLTVHYLREERRWLRALLLGAEVLSFLLLGIQGSQGGLLTLAVCAGTSLWLGRRESAVLRRMFLALAGFFCGMPLMWELMKSRGKKAAIPADGNVFEGTKWYVWAAGAAVCVLLFRFFRKKDFPERTGERKRRLPGAVAAAAAVGGIAAAACLAGYLTEDGFGSGRGFLWRISLESFSRAEPGEKLLGAGPDCYGEAVFNRLGTGTEVWKDEHWEGAVFTNAHNEVLSQLCNVGLLGTGGYLAIFAVGLYNGYLTEAGGKRKGTKGKETEGREIERRETGCRFDYRWLGGLALAMYGFHALISFQQVLNTPLLFLTLGICEAERRRFRGKNGDTGGRNHEVEEI